MSHAGDVRCACVAAHSPLPVDIQVHHVWPLAWGGPDVATNRVPLCPTTHASVHWLLRAYQRAGGEPAWEVRRRVGPYARALAKQGWDAYQASRP